MGDIPQHRREMKVVGELCMGEGSLGPHPHVVRVWNTMLLDINPPFPRKCVIIMDLCDGNLKTYLSNLSQTQVSNLSQTQVNISAAQILSIAIQILDGLRYCHSRNYFRGNNTPRINYTHRDLKPTNSIFYL